MKKKKQTDRRVHLPEGEEQLAALAENRRADQEERQHRAGDEEEAREYAAVPHGTVQHPPQTSVHGGCFSAGSLRKHSSRSH